MSTASLRIRIIQPRMLSKADAADYMGLTAEEFLRRGIASVDLGGKQLWDVRDLDADIDATKSGGGADEDIVARLS